MNASSLKRLFTKRGSAGDDKQGARAHNDTSAMTENPYLSARRSWNEHVGAVVSARQTWTVVGILSLLTALGAVGGMTAMGMQSKFIPYVIEVDKLGQTLAAGPVTAAAKADSRVIHAAVTDFVSNARLVTPDVALQRRSVFRVYSMLSPNDPSTAKMNEWLNGNEDASPFKRATKEMVSVEVRTALQQTQETWQIDWIETTRDRQGVLKGPPVNMRALVTVYTAAPSAQTSDEQLRNNPMSIYVRDFSWSKQL